MIEILIFWMAVFILLYIYLLFPMILFMRARLFPRPYDSAPITPSVTLVIAAHNEAQSIEAKMKNALALDYPRGLLEVIIASDGSDDGTNEIVSRYAGDQIRLMALPRLGKADALNEAIATAKGEILVFSDANSMYATDAIRQLVQPFADQAVGGVAGNQCYLKSGQPGLSRSSEQSYWNLDRRLKQFESQAGNTISATGAIYAIRRSLFQQVPVGVTDDFTTSTAIIAQGHRLVFAPDAIAYEPVSATEKHEYGRKVRITTRGLRAVLLRRALLNPINYGFYALQLFSHKLLRRLAIFPLLTMLFVAPFVWSHGIFYQLAVLAQVGLYGLALGGHLLKGTRLGKLKPLSLPYYFCLVNIACLHAVFNLLRGHRIDRWDTQRPSLSNQES